MISPTFRSGEASSGRSLDVVASSTASIEHCRRAASASTSAPEADRYLEAQSEDATGPAASARRGDQSALEMRAGAPAAQGGARARSLRGPHLARPPPPRADDTHQLRLPSAPAASRDRPSPRAGRKRNRRAADHRNDWCLRFVPLSSPAHRRSTCDAPHVTDGWSISRPRRCG